MNIINNKYKLLEKIGSGTFGSIYKAEHLRTKQLVAIKMESIDSKCKMLKNESTIYHYLSKKPGIPTVKWFGKDEENYYMVINLLGPSLQTVKNNRGRFSLKLTLQIGIKIIILLKTIHEQGLIHRDIKPDNFLLGLELEEKNKKDEKNKNEIYIIDFGFCKTYIDETTETNHIPMLKTANIIGSLTYASINAHLLNQLSRRDDLESLGYMLIYFHLGHLEWQHSTKDEIYIYKKNILDNPAVSDILNAYMKSVRTIAFEERPDYEELINTFIKGIKRETELELV